MSRTNTISSLSNLLLMLFLLTCVISSSLTAFAEASVSHKFIISKKSEIPSHSDLQIQFQEREKEERENDESSENGKVLSFLTVESILFTLSETQSYAFYESPSVLRNSTGVPLYIVIRKLLI
jgi:hypothetical protein